MRVLVIGGPEFGRQAEAAMVDAGVIVRISRAESPSGGLLRRIETSGTPFVAVIDGPVGPAAFEIALACHYRVAADDPSIRIVVCDPRAERVPECGATQRLPRLAGVPRALALLLEGKALTVQDAQAAGLLDAVVPADSVIAHAESWIAAQNGRIRQPWDRPGFRIPGLTGAPFGAAVATLRASTLSMYPAPLAILSSVYEGCQVDLDNGLKIEARYAAHVRATAESRNLARLRRFREELGGVPRSEFSRIGILGAGMMGSGIAYSCAAAGLDVVLLDVTREKAERGRAAALGVFEKRGANGRFASIHATCDFADLEECEVVIEAVFEDRAEKAEVTRNTEAVTGSGILFASNTSTLPITGLAEAWTRPENFIGMHFFSPVDRMPLVEIIRGKQTSEASLARALDLGRRVGKTPIVVNDSRGFYTSRVFSTFLNEGMCMLLEGISPALIENCGRMAGMPGGPLAVADEVSLDLIGRVRLQTQADLGDRYRPNATDEVLRIMIEEQGRHGRKSRQGFYDYRESGRKRLWPGLEQCFPRRSESDAAELVRRFLWVQSLETVRCLEEGVLLDRRDADVGSVLGWSFCPALGGTIGHIETVGREKFLADAERLERAYGERFAPPQLLRTLDFGPAGGTTC